MSKHILVVDDDILITTTLKTFVGTILKHEVTVFNKPAEAIEFLKERGSEIDMVLSDFMMPEMNGLEFLKEAKELSPYSIRILLTGYADKDNAIKSINEVGLYYYMEKPWDNEVLMKTINNGLEKKELESNLKQKHEEIKKLYEILQKDYTDEKKGMKSIMTTLSNLIEAKDKYTDGHTRRVSLISEKLAKKMNLNDKQLETIEMGAILHDIGKVAVPDQILNKHGKLDEEEFKEMQNHTVFGEYICKPLPSLDNCLDLIRHHHEKLNGLGYPDGLKGDEIGVETRILATADIFDALYTRRPYKEPMSIEKVKMILNEEVEKNALDEKLVKTLYEIYDEGEIEPLYTESVYVEE